MQENKKEMINNGQKRQKFKLKIDGKIIITTFSFKMSPRTFKSVKNWNIYDNICESWHIWPTFYKNYDNSVKS